MPRRRRLAVRSLRRTELRRRRGGGCAARRRLDAGGAMRSGAAPRARLTAERHRLLLERREVALLERPPAGSDARTVERGLALVLMRDLLRPVRRVHELAGGAARPPTLIAPSDGRAVFLQRGELEERLLDQLVDDRALRRTDALLLAHRALHDRRDVEVLIGWPNEKRKRDRS